jgi:hypothetical protein
MVNKYEGTCIASCPCPASETPGVILGRQVTFRYALSIDLAVKEYVAQVLLVTNTRL